MGGVNLVDLSVETRSIPLKMASRMVSTSFLMAISLAIFCVSRAQSQEQYLNQGYEGYEGPHEPEEYMGPMDPNPAQFVAVENRAPDFFWRPMRSVNQFLVRPTRIPTASDAKKSDFFFMRPMKREYFVVRRSGEYQPKRQNPFWVRPTRASPM